MVTLQNAENALKSVYLGTVTDLLNTRVNPLLSKIEQTSSDVWGKEIRTAAKFGINGGVGAGDEDGDLPAAFGNNYLQFVTTLKNLYGQIEISDKAIRASADGRGAFTDLLNAELEGLLNASKFNLGRMLYGDGTGLLATFAEKSTSDNTIVCDTARNLIEGLAVDVYGANGTKKGTARISYVDRAQKTVTLDGATVTLAAGDKMYVQGSKDKEITGIGALFNGSSIYGVQKSAHPFLNPYTKNVGGAIDEIVMQEAIDALENDAGSTVDFLACSQDAKYSFIEYMSSYKRNIDIMELEGGFKTLSYNGLPLVYDRFVPDGSMYLLNTKAFKLHQLCDWRFIETENGKILRQNQGKPTYTATLVKYCDLICQKPNGQAVLTGITR
ncbi:phage major capsid protein [Anaerocaecibacter muris]|uniref:phage major capsid protein n=1 Tax=Anaerocaecibacter muris TaxID=2941513 RepID=UPI00203EF296|nr:phage major capsid protein [Anaerocaecibacter muris]